MIPIPHNNDDRIAALLSYCVLDTPKEESYDALTNLDSKIFDVHISLVSLVDEGRQWFKSAYGLSAQETPRSEAFCTYAIMPLWTPYLLLCLMRLLMNALNITSWSWEDQKSGSTLVYLWSRWMDTILAHSALLIQNQGMLLGYLKSAN
tara:strand:+ start:93 stop:539 length:447 start_codon:yes stop_codon:yes gene_type:complete